MKLALLAVAVLLPGALWCMAPGALVPPAMALTNDPTEAIYNPQSKSYFQFIPMRGRPLSWAEAAEAAQRLTFKGVSGRLAVVNNVESHDFLLRNFHSVMDGTWIGLRLDCGDRKLKWIDGSVLGPEGFTVWDMAKWHRTDITCDGGQIALMGVYYLPREQFFRWQAAGEHKVMTSMFVEYPTGKP